MLNNSDQEIDSFVAAPLARRQRRTREVDVSDDEYTPPAKRQATEPAERASKRAAKRAAKRTVTSEVAEEERIVSEEESASALKSRLGVEEDEEEEYEEYEEDGVDGVFNKYEFAVEGFECDGGGALEKLGEWKFGGVDVCVMVLVVRCVRSRERRWAVPILPIRSDD